MFEKLKSRQFEIVTLHHAEAILKHDMLSAVKELEELLCGIYITPQELVKGGGGEGQLTQRLRKALEESGWHKHKFEIKHWLTVSNENLYHMKSII